jgi:putative copper resistance protein D
LEIDPLFWWRILSAAADDIDIAVLCGFLLASLWLRPIAIPGASASRNLSQYLSLPALSWPAAILPIVLCVQLLLLSATFTGQTSLRTIIAALPDVLSTHAGCITSWTIVAGIALFGMTLLPLRNSTRHVGCVISLCACILLRSASGHAAVEGDFTFDELLQFIHLSAMALWSGGVLVSGLLVLPRLNRLTAHTEAPSFQTGSHRHSSDPPFLKRYLGSLSRLSLWAVLAIALSGLLKSYRALGGNPRLLGHGLWSWILIAKIACVAAALALGGLHNRRLASSAPWSNLANRRSVHLLRAEACFMVVILFLSAWLANVPPPGE